MDRQTTVKPHQLCDRCAVIVGIYTKDEFWAKEPQDYDVPSHPSTELPNPVPESRCESRKLRYHDSLLHLHQASIDGCHLCSLFVGSLKKQSTPCFTSGTIYMKFGVRHQEADLDGCQSTVLSLEVTEVATEVYASVIMHRHRCIGTKVACKAGLDAGCDIPGEAETDWSISVELPDVYEMLKSWLQRCISLHEMCRYGLSIKPPLRVLDLCPYPESTDIRLVHTDEVEVESYVTLSYRWGQSLPHHVLRKDNYDRLRTQIQVHSLPRTIREAIDVCRGMAVRYLWVDALCIIQEDGEDFANEVANMGSIFAGSLFTVAATDSRSSDSSLFGRFWPLENRSCVFGGSTDVRWVIEPFYPYRNRHRWDLSEMNLSSRGWVFQERLLSPRTIHYVGNGIIWECREQLFCRECGVMNRIPGKIDPLYARFEAPWYDGKRGLLGIYQGWKQTEHQLRLRTVWAYLLYYYSKTELTSVDDRLSALAGIVQFVRSDASYGLWIDFFIEELRWYTVYNAGNAGFYHEIRSRSPSWSWVSIRGVIQNIGQRFDKDDREDYMLQHQKDYQTLISAKVTRYPPVTPFELISVLYHQLPQPVSFKICGKIRACHLMPYWRVWTMDWRLFPVTPFTNVSDLQRAWGAHRSNDEDEIDRLTHQNELTSTGVSKLDYYPDTHPEYRLIFYCLLLKRELRGRVLTDSGLVLQQVSFKNRLYKRLGYFEEASGDVWPCLSPTEHAIETTVEVDVSQLTSQLTIFGEEGAGIEAEIEIV